MSKGLLGRMQDAIVQDLNTCSSDVFASNGLEERGVPARHGGVLCICQFRYAEKHR